MTTSSMATILQAQSLLMAEHDVTSETALGLLVWESDRRSVTVADVATGVCAALAGGRGADVDGLLRATA
ncbi:ANTAR domain-containing protein [Aeromicrobium sp. CFBP 8757]|uniref:ANTAR domain-containing protein n=1 Tax=Aeromicrobium sp. CFBP 8757 TaxID=2775288 RepID=UPI001786EC85|nr:ANTAR domain-containing protein [Aeromicrobium sp. CFBP 8757]MBD8606609.1 ANTAR domain-containing protein [Aeromicrobium sp. CFBP 8757]